MEHPHELHQEVHTAEDMYLSIKKALNVDFICKCEQEVSFSQKEEWRLTRLCFCSVEIIMFQCLCSSKYECAALLLLLLLLLYLALGAGCYGIIPGVASKDGIASVSAPRGRISRENCYNL